MAANGKFVEEAQPAMPANSREVLRGIEADEEKVRLAQGSAIKGAAAANPEDLVCASWARKEIASARGSALATKTIFSHCFVIPWSSVGFRSVYGLLMLFLAIVVQVAVPLIILATRQPVRDLPNACPNQSSVQTKIIGFTLSLYFVVQTVSLCINKLRGLGFLHMFVDLGFARSCFIKLAIVSQFCGMAAAGGAQFLLFIGNADGAFVVLVLQSLAMTFCLTVDQNIVVRSPPPHHTPIKTSQFSTLIIVKSFYFLTHSNLIWGWMVASSWIGISCLLLRATKSARGRSTACRPWPRTSCSTAVPASAGTAGQSQSLPSTRSACSCWERK